MHNRSCLYPRLGLSLNSLYFDEVGAIKDLGVNRRADALALDPLAAALGQLVVPWPLVLQPLIKQHCCRGSEQFVDQRFTLRCRQQLIRCKHARRSVPTIVRVNGCSGQQHGKSRDTKAPHLTEIS